MPEVLPLICLNFTRKMILPTCFSYANCICVICYQDEFTDSRALDVYRQQRLKELQEKRVRSRFGDVVEIAKDEWVREVTEGSAGGTWVVVHLYLDALVESSLLDEATINLARRFPYIKFLKIRATSAVENWPERNCPTLFLYRDGELREQMITLTKVGGKAMKVAGELYVCYKIATTTKVLFNFRSRMVVCKEGNYHRF